MTIPGGQGGIKTPSAPGSASVGPTLFQVVVRSVDPTASPPVAIVNDTMGREIPVRIDLQRGKGSIPSPGERWVIDKSMGVWTFACFVGGDPAGVGQFDVAAVSGLSDALSAHDDDLAAHDARLDTMFSQGTVTATQGTTATVTMTDGSVATGVQTVGAYQPVVGDTVWTGTVDAAGSKVALGTSADASSNQQAYDVTISHYLTTSRIRDAQVNIWSDHRIAAGDQGTTPVYEISLFHCDTNGNVYLNSELDFVTYGSDMAALIKNDNYKTGMLWGNGRIYFTQNTGNGRIPIEAMSMTSTLGGGMTMGADANGNASIIYPYRDISLVAGVDGLHVADAANTKFNPILTGPLTVTGGINGSFGAAFGGATVFANAGLTVTGQTSVQGIIGTFGCSFHGADASFDNVKMPGHNISTDPAGSMNSLDYYGGNFHGVVVSEKRAKREHDRISNGLDVINALRPVTYSWLDPERDRNEGELIGRLRAGIYVDDVEAVAPEAVFHLKRRAAHAHESLEEHAGRDANRPVATDERNFEDRAVIAYLIDAVQTLAARVVALEQAPVTDSGPPTKE